ncbi:MAG: AI-2E family transporter [Sphingomonadales bacterium]|nr:AI-2E family transporter [Sphingomonadales bacterium]
MDETGSTTGGSFTGRVVRALAIVALALACWRLLDALLLLFSAILLAVALRGLAMRLHALTGAAIGLCLGVVVLVLVATAAAVLWLFGSQIALQYNEIAHRAPVAVTALIDTARAHPLGHYFVGGLDGAGAGSASGAITGVLTSLVTASLAGLAYVALVFFGGLYLAAEPDRYRTGFLRLVPPDRRVAVAGFLDDCTTILRRWLLGQLVVMLTIGVLSGCGLWLLGIDAAIALGLTGGLLCFVPYVGAILAAVPAVLMAFAQSPADAFYVALLFMGVHFVEGNFVTPMVEDRSVSLPPVISIFSTLVFSILFGPVSVMVAVPVTIVAITALETFYVARPGKGA